MLARGLLGVGVKNSILALTPLSPFFTILETLETR